MPLRDGGGEGPAAARGSRPSPRARLLYPSPRGQTTVTRSTALRFTSPQPTPSPPPACYRERAVSRPYLVAALLAVLALACDRNVEPFVPGEEPRQPDLSRIFPAGAERAEQRAGGAVEMPPAAEQGGRGADPTAEAPPIRGVIRVADALAGGVPPNAVLFLIARGGAGGPPLAVQRIPGPRFPFEFELGPGDRMIRTLPFAGELSLSARLDQDGDAGTRTPGDLEGAAAGAHAPGATGVEIVLDRAL
jgi:hypothetical protein